VAETDGQDEGRRLEDVGVQRPPLDPDDEIPVASTSDSSGQRWRLDASDLAPEMVSTPLAPQALHLWMARGAGPLGGLLSAVDHASVGCALARCRFQQYQTACTTYPDMPA